jgi:N6-adenosine-specific RNA methylase IME4
MTISLPLFSFDVVMCDPPWPWRAYSDKGHRKSPEAQYSTMSYQDIERLRVGDLLAPGGVLFLWCTWPQIECQAALMRRWGVAPKTGGAWAKRTSTGKLRWGTGYLLRSVCEPFLIGTLDGASVRGASLANLIETIDDALVDGLARQHSRKPDEAYSLLEALSPNARRADVFSRQSRPGWESWGLETTKYDEEAA